MKVRLGSKLVDIYAGESAVARVGEVYRDAPDALLDAIGAGIRSGVPWRDAAVAHLGSLNPWLLRVVTDPSRTLWLEKHPVAHDTRILDVGAGWGQWAVPAAATARVVALEPNPSRLAVMEAIARQEGVAERMHFVGARLEDVEFPGTLFDQIFCIGVLEWVPRFSPGAEPLKAQEEFLARIHGMLVDKGQCIIGIENRLGLKYLLGAPDDHTGLPGISVLGGSSASRRYLEETGQKLDVFTYTMEEYRLMLSHAGFTHVNFYAAFPDYKVPQVIVPLAVGAADEHCLNGAFIPEHNGSNGERLGFQDELESHYRSLAALGVAGIFAPSFFIQAS